MRCLFAIAALALAVPSAAADLPLIHEPFAIAAPASVAVDWESFDRLPPAMDGVGLLRTPAPRERAGRIDVLQRDGGKWSWASTHATSLEMHYEPAPMLRGVLLRYKNDAHYFWAEIPAGASAPIDLVEWRNVSAVNAPAAAALALYLDFETEPRTLAEGETTFRFVPLQGGLLCGTSLAVTRCSVIDGARTRFDLSNARDGETRVLRAEAQADDQFNVLAKGNVAIRPRKAATTIAKTSRWVALTLEDSSFAWEHVVVDRTGGELALGRWAGAALAPPPGFTDLSGSRERGITVRPWIGAKKAALTDSESLLVVFPQGDGLASQIPLATASPDSAALLQLPELAPGAYALKLLSSQTTADPVKVSIMSGVPLDVTFPSGPTVSGRVTRSMGGAANEPVLIEVAAELSVQEALNTDLTEKVRFTNADANGNFTLVIPSPGNYRLRARWGSASVERTFEIGKAMRDVELGQLDLAAHATLRGSVTTACHGGEAVLIPVPDLTGNVAIGFKELRRTSLDEQGRFTIDGLTPGSWSIFLLCDGQHVTVAPEFFPVPEQGDVIMEFGPPAPGAP